MKPTILSLFSDVIKRNKNHIAIKYKNNKAWKNISWHEYFNIVKNIHTGLTEVGLKENDTVCIIGSTSYQWVLADLAIMSVGATTVPIYKNSLDSDIEYIINNSEAKYIFCEDEATADQIKALKCKDLKIISFSDTNNTNYLNFNELANKKSKLTNEKFKKILNSIHIDNTATIIYTSGTTGIPKGVVLTHKQIMSEVIDLFHNYSIDHNDVSLCFLPLAHIMGRIESLGNIHKPYTIAFAESVDLIKKNIAEIKPTFIVAVPRIFEKIYNGVLNQINTKKSTIKIFSWASNIGSQVSNLKVNKRSVPITLAIQYKLAQKLVFKKIQMALGGRIRFAISGGAPLEKKISEFFHAANILILEAYGLTETTAAVTANTLFDYKFGTVGKPLGDSEIKLADDGEILVKSDKVMKEYFKNPEATAEAFDGDYFKTGDIGLITQDGFIKITDRKKDLIKTAGGKYVAPQKLENLLKIDPMIANVLIHGDKKKFIIALVTLDNDCLKQFAKNNSISYSNTEALSKHKNVYQHVKAIVAEVNSELARYETIKNFAILPREFTTETGELTPSMKVRRKHCDKKFEKEILSLYGIDKSSI